MPLQLTIKEWRIYYDTKDTVFGKTLEEWRNANNEGVECVALFYEDGKPEVIAKKELYMMFDGKHGTTFVSTKTKPNPWQEFCELDEIKIGKIMESHAFYDIMRKAQEDTYGSLL